MSKLPWFAFYPDAWMSEPGLRASCLAAKGLWMDLLCMMHKSPRRGFLETSQGKPPTPEEIARMVGSTPEEVAPLLEELKTNNVTSQTSVGLVYSRRMKRDEISKAKSRGRYQKWYNKHKINNNSNGHLTPLPTPTQQVEVKYKKLNKSLKTNTTENSLQEFSRLAESQTLDSDPQFDLLSGPSEVTHDSAISTETQTSTHPSSPETSPGETSTTRPSETQTSARDTNHRDSSLLAALFRHYCTLCHRDPTRYTLTPQRKHKALLRLQEQIKLTGSLAQAIENLQTAISNLAASDFHMSHGYTDWEAQIFKSKEEFERRLNWQPSTPEVSHDESVDQYNARISRQAKSKLDH